MIQGSDIVQQVSFQAKDIVYILGGFATFFGLIITGFLKLQADTRKSLSEALNGQSTARHEDIVTQLKEVKAETRRISDSQVAIANALESVAKINAEMLQIIRSHEHQHWEGAERRRRKE